MGSKFLGQGGATDLSALQTGTLQINVASIADQDLVPDGPIRSSNRNLVVGLIGKTDLNFTALSDPFDGALRVRDITTAYDTAPEGLNSFISTTSSKTQNQTATPGATAFTGAVTIDGNSSVDGNLSVSGTAFLKDDNIALLVATNLAGTATVPLDIEAPVLQVPRTTTTNTDVSNSTTLLTKAQVEAEILAAEPQPLAPTDTPTFAGLSIEDGLSTDLNLGVFAGAPRITSSVVGLPGPLTLDASRVEVPLTTTLNTNVNDPTTLLTKAQVQAEIATAAPQPLAPTDTPTFARLSVSDTSVASSAIVDLTSSSIAEILATDGSASIPLSITADPLLVPRTLTANTDTTDPTTLLTKAQVQAIVAVEPQPLATTETPTFAGALFEGDVRLEASGVDPRVLLLGTSTVLRLEPDGAEARITSTSGIAPRPLVLSASAVSATAPFTAPIVTATTRMVAPNLLGPVLTFGGNIGRDDDPDYLIAGARAGQNAEGNLRIYSAHVCPCSGLLSLAYVKESSDTHVFSLLQYDPSTQTTSLISNFQLAGNTGVLPTTTAVQVGDLLLLQHNISTVPASAPDRTLVNLYLRPLGNAVPTLVSSSSYSVTATAESTEKTAVLTDTAATQQISVTARHEEWEVV